VTREKFYLRLRERDLIRGGNSVFRLEDESLEVVKDAELFARWIREGSLTIEQAKKNDLLPTPLQFRSLRDETDSQLLRDVMRRRTETWRALVRMLAADATRSIVPRATPKRAQAAAGK
jgi:hypothetical protein